LRRDVESHRTWRNDLFSSLIREVAGAARKPSMTRLRFDRYLVRPVTRHGSEVGDVQPVGLSRSVEDAVRELPPLPSMMTELLSEMGSLDADIGLLQERISRDPTLTTRLLRMANSAYYSPRAQICSVGQALMILGLRSARNLVLATAMRAVIRTQRAVPGFEIGGTFCHSVAVAVACGRLGKVAPALHGRGESLFVAGLLHDVGMIALADEYARAHGALEAAGDMDLAVERDVLGIDHQQVGKVVWEHWKLPEELLIPITRHHDLPERVNDPVTVAVMLADEHADLMGFGLRLPRGQGEVIDRCAGLLGISGATALAALADMDKEVQSFMGSLK
jgi:HD-like signal output (HDOD) protein